jgi:CRP-like cAMP-binding protein
MHSTSHAQLDKKLKPIVPMYFDRQPVPCLVSKPPPHNHFCSEHDEPEADDPRKNFLLAALPDDEYERIAPHLEPFPLPRADILYRFDEHLEYTYFPTTATVSLLCTMEDGASIEVAVVGDEGLLGASILGDTALTQATVLNCGNSYRLNAKWLKYEIEQHGYLQSLVMRYTRTLIAQMAQTTGCIRRHSVEQQLSRCLLLNLDRASCGSLTMTQEMMAGMLGVRRESITEVARKLQSAKLISYNRGHIEVLNRPGLEARACECYDVTKSELGRLHADLLAA